MPVNNRIADLHGEMTEWRRDIHAHPELGFEENRTSDIVAEKLASFGIEVHRGIAKTGVVGTLKGGEGTRAIALRADMDALPIQERNAVDHCSQNDGKMHACGHDGHTTMLLGAAKYLAETRNFSGTVHFVFQPAEEGLGGGRAMVEEGLFDQFPAEAVYGMHNWPGLPPGEIAVRTGPMMAACDEFKITISGKGAHAAMPHLGNDPVVMSAQIVSALQTITSRTLDPLDSAVLSVTTIHGGDAFNVIPESVVLGGTVRTFREEVQNTVERRMREIVENTCAAFGGRAETEFHRRFPATVNTATETDHAAVAAAEVVGADKVHRDLDPSRATGRAWSKLNCRKPAEAAD
jgi:hippurate hydrolase